MDQYAYRLAPWRKQVRVIIYIATLAILSAFVAWIYLYFSAQMTDMKLKIQELHDERNALSREIAHLLTLEGDLTAYSVMEKKATNAGYYPIDFTNEDIYSYVLVDGYQGERPLAFSIQTEQNPLPVPKLRPEFQTSLKHWLYEEMQSLRRVK